MIPRARLKANIKRVLQLHVGADACISMAQLHRAASGELIYPGRRYDQTRATRSCVAQLRREGCPIGYRMGRAGGYFWAASARELESTIHTFHGRALSSLAQEKALRRITSAQLARQIELELETTQPEDFDDE